MLDRLVCFVICGFEFTVRAVVGVRLVMEATVGKRPAETFVEKQEKERNLHALGGESVGISAAIALEEAVAF